MGKRVGTAKWMEKQNRWQIKVMKDGERRTFTSSVPGRNGQREANAKADAWLDEGVTDPSRRVSIIYDEYIETLKATTSKSNWRQVESLWKNWIGPQIDKKKISDVNEAHLQKPIDRACGAGRSKKTLLNILNIERAFIKYCRKAKYTTLNPENVSIPKSAQYLGKKILQPHDIIKLFNCENTTNWSKIEFDRNVYAYRFQVITGLRPGELIGLRWSDISGKTIHVRRAVNVLGEETTGKNRNAVRSFVLTPMALDLLEKQKTILPLGTSDTIFGIPSLSGYEKRWKKFCAYNGISEVTPYELRHTFVSVAKRLPEGMVKPLVGHAADMDTFGVYGHYFDGDGEETAVEIDKVFQRILGAKVGE